MAAEGDRGPVWQGTCVHGVSEWTQHTSTQNHCIAFAWQDAHACGAIPDSVRSAILLLVLHVYALRVRGCYKARGDVCVRVCRYDNELREPLLYELRVYMAGLSDESGAGQPLAMAIKQLGSPSRDQVRPHAVRPTRLTS